MRPVILILLLFSLSVVRAQDNIISYTAKDVNQIQLYWKDNAGKLLSSFQNLKDFLVSKKQQLIFAMNGGMFNKDMGPVGLFIEKGKVLKSINKVSGGGGNFGMKPNGVFYITNDNKAFICKTEDFTNTGKIKYATQSGPMLVINDSIHAAFNKNSINTNIRNGVGILPDGSVLFAISSGEITFYDFALFFKKSGCRNALYLDGAISQMYCPEKRLSSAGGSFGVIIGVTTSKK